MTRFRYACELETVVDIAASGTLLPPSANPAEAPAPLSATSQVNGLVALRLPGLNWAWIRYEPPQTPVVGSTTFGS